MKQVGTLGLELRRALNEVRGFVTADEISAALERASYTVFGHFVGHVALYRPGQPLAPRAYQLTERLDVALRPFLQAQQYSQDPAAQQNGVLPIFGDGSFFFPPAPLDAAGAPLVGGSFQFPTGLLVPGARKVTALNDNAVQERLANAIVAPTARFPVRYNTPTGWCVAPAPAALTLLYLAAPPRPVYAETAADDAGLDVVYDDANSVDIGWLDLTARNEILAFATQYLGGPQHDTAATGLAAQFLARGA